MSGKITTEVDTRPKIFAVSSEEKLLGEIKEYVENYNYRYVGSAFKKEDIMIKIGELSPDLILLDADEKGLDLLELSDEFELYNTPMITIVGEEFNEIIDKIIMSTPYGYLIKDIDEEELQRAMAVAIKKHTQNTENIKIAKCRIKEKNIELLIEKSDSSFLLIICVALILMAVFTRNATWLQWVLIIPTGAMLINSLVSIRKQSEVIEYEKYPFISIFIPAHNEEYTIQSTVESICSCDYPNEEGEPNFEVIVVNDGSTDDTGKILSEMKNKFSQLKIVTRYPPRSGKGKGFVLNDALTLSRGEIIGVFDADTQIKSHYLKTIVNYLNDPEIDGVQSRVKMYNKDENFLARMQHVEFGSFGNTLIAKDNLGKTGFLGGNGQFVKKQSIIDSGRWDGFAVTEDLNLAIKIMLQGGKIRYCGDVAVYQEAVTSWKPFFRQRVRWAIGNFETLFVYLPQILRAKIPLAKKFNILEHISFYSFNLLIFFGFLITILNAISWFFFHNVTIIRMDAPFIIGFLSVIAFFPGIMIALSRDNPSQLEFIKDIVKYYVYCFHLIPLFFMTMVNMMTRKERKWAKTEHKGGD